MIAVRIGDAAFDASEEIARLSVEGAGAVASFIGFVRGGNGLVSLTLDHYPAMTERALNSLVAEAQSRWQLSAVSIVHRTGTLHPGDPIVFVAASSAHRAAALDACAFLIDRLKTDAPFWKHERFNDGREHWVDARCSDDAAAARWA